MQLGLSLSIVQQAYSGGPSGPTNTVAPVISGTATVGQTLSSTTGTWTGEGTITYAYQWLDDGAEISGATSSTYTLTAGEEGGFITCRVTATDDNGSTAATSNSLGPVAASSFNPADLFQSGTYTGLFLDFSEVSSMHTDLAGTTAITASGDPIRSVNDLSGTGNRLNSQFTSTAPTYTESGGLAGAFYTASAAERLVRNSGVIGVPTGISATDEITVAIAAVASSQAGHLIWNDGGIGGSNDYIYCKGQFGSSSIRAQAVTGEIMVDNVAGSQTIGTPHVHLMEKVGGYGYHYLDGTLTDTDGGGVFSTWNLTLDASLDLRSNGQTIYAVFVINRALTAQERSDLTDWLKAKAGVA